MSPPHENQSRQFSLSCAASAADHEFNAQERGVLLQLAHEAILSALEDRAISLDAPTPHLAERRAAFTTLYLFGQLRGCVGYVFPAESTYQTVAETARAAAFEDTRFRKVTIDEARHLEVSLSILSLMRRIGPEEVEVGRHGLLVSGGGHRGLLLPQVPVEHGWDRITFLQETCRKAGLPEDAWLKGASIEAFTAEVFGDRD